MGHQKLIQKLTDCNFKQVQKDQRSWVYPWSSVDAVLRWKNYRAVFFPLQLMDLYHTFFLQSDSITKGKVVSPAANYISMKFYRKWIAPDSHGMAATADAEDRLENRTVRRESAWSIGYNKNYTVEYGGKFFSAVVRPDLSGANIATPLLFKNF